MGRRFNLRGYTVVTSLSHGLLGELKKRIDSLERFKGSSRVFIGAGAAIADFPPPEKTILVVGCTRQALFDEELAPEDSAYRKLFGDRVMMEVQAYVRKIPSQQVSFREEVTPAGDKTDLVERIETVFKIKEISLTDEDLKSLKSNLG